MESASKVMKGVAAAAQAVVDEAIQAAKSSDKPAVGDGSAKPADGGGRA